MNKRKLNAMHDALYAKIRAFLAKKTRVRIFKKKSHKNALTREQIREVKRFFAPYAIPNMAFHRFFTEKTGDFYPNYIPIDLYVGYIDPYFNDLHAVKFIDNKCYYDSWFHDFPQPYLVLKRVNNIWLDHYGKPADSERMKAIIEEEKEGLFLKKAEDSLGGLGVTFIESNTEAFYNIVNLSKQIKCDIVIQRRIIQHAEFAKFNSASVNTIRIYSILRKDGSVKIYSSVFRIGVGNARVDNYVSGGVSCGINADGTLKKYAYNKNGERTDIHPHSKIVFEGSKLPFYEKAVELVKKAHLTIPHFRSVSWDIAIGEDGNPILIEANLSRGSIDLLQLSNGPMFGEDTKEILDEVFAKSKKC